MNKLDKYKKHVISRIENTEIGRLPFRHIYIEEIFPQDFYNSILQFALEAKNSKKLITRFQDSTLYDNTRYNFTNDNAEIVAELKSIFSDTEVKKSLLKKFYLENINYLANNLSVHEHEFEFTYTKAKRFQNVHLDIPPKYLSFVFYLPDQETNLEDQKNNSTLLYDRYLNPYYHARYKGNSVGIFAQHFYSYHGNSTTIDRNAMVLFYVNQDELDTWNSVKNNETEPYDLFKDYTQNKLERHPLIEYGHSIKKIIAERNDCRINSPRGRYLSNSNTFRNIKR